MSKEKQIVEQLTKDIKFRKQVIPNPKEDADHQLARLLVSDGYRKQSENMVEVVRCKDCKRFLEMETSPSYDGKCLGYGYLVEAKHYCSYGELKMKGGEK